MQIPTKEYILFDSNNVRKSSAVIKINSTIYLQYYKGRHVKKEFEFDFKKVLAMFVPIAT